MKNRYQLVFLNLIITVISIYFTYAVYDEYKKSQKIKVDNYIEKTIIQNEKAIKNTLLKIREEIEKDKKIFQEIHTKYTKLLREDPTLDIFELKKDILSKYTLRNRDIHLFLLNKQYTVTHSTYAPDIGFKLADVTDARTELDKAEDGGVYQSPSISIDLINSEVKSYSYSKINDTLYFEMGFINMNINNSLKSVMSKIQLLTNKQSNLYRIEQKIDGSEYYDDILNKKVDKTKEEYLSSKKKFKKDLPTDNLIILSNRTGKNLKKYLDDALIVYIPLIKKHNDYLKMMGDFVLELYINREYEKSINQKVENYFFIFLLFHIFFLLIIFYFTKKYHDSQLKLRQKVKENQTLLEENKDFIAGMTKQIEAPLSVIINNYDFIQKDLSKELIKYDEQINSSINMLENSYNELNYIINNERFDYIPSKIDFSQFLKSRVEFFNVVAKSQGAIIKTQIEEDISLFMNTIELERLIDNNLSNAIKHGDAGKEILVTLSKENKSLLLRFFSFSSEIENKSKIFHKNFQESKRSKKSLGLGLSMVKSICEKYDITYKVTYEDHHNIFTYDLYKIEQL